MSMEEMAETGEGERLIIPICAPSHSGEFLAFPRSGIGFSPSAEDLLL